MADSSSRSSVKMPPRISILPPREVEASAPPMANQIRVISAADALTIHAYYISPTLIESAVMGTSETGVKIDGEVAYVETTPAARFAIPLTVAVSLTELLISNLISIGPGVTPYIDAFLKKLQGAGGENR